MTKANDYVVFASDGGRASEKAPPAGYQLQLWEPALTAVVPPGAPRPSYTAWWLFDRAHAFRNAGYGVVLVWSGDVLAHRLGIFPGWYRFPFMGPDDLQLGDLWTDPAHRGRGLASAAIAFALRARVDARRFWYVTHQANTASIRTAERAGLHLVGTATRTRPFGVRLFGRFRLREGDVPDPGPPR